MLRQHLPRVELPLPKVISLPTVKPKIDFKQPSGESQLPKHSSIHGP
jgi:hypothetical protein